MVKRKCGTCKYFQDKGLANSGWCRHPERCDIQDMVLVRKAELACRNGWDHDLWEPSGVDDAAAHHEGQHPEIPNPTVPTVQPGMNRSVRPAVPPATTRPAVPDPSYTDKLTAISLRLPPRSAGSETDDHPAVRAVSEPVPSGLSAEESRLAVRETRRRREEARKAETRQTMQTIVREAGDLLDGGNTPRTPAPAAVPGLPGARADVRHDWRPGPIVPPATPPVRRGELPAPRTSVPEVRGAVEFPATPPRFGQRSDANPGEIPERPAVVSDSPSVDLPATMRGSAVASGSTRLEPGETAPLPVVTPAAELNARSDERSFNTRMLGQATATGNRARQHQMPLEPRTPSVSGRQPLTEARRDVAIVPIALALRQDPIDAAPIVSAVARCCETCRDFKRHGDSDTGWCANPHAFAERRMVRSQELACRSSIGVWWLPHDDLWLERADTTHHGLPTPILDEELQTGSMGRQRMGPRSS